MRSGVANKRKIVNAEELRSLREWRKDPWNYGEKDDTKTDIEKNILNEKFERSIELKQLPVPQKIRYVIEQNPILGIRGIKKMLKSDHFGNAKIGTLKLWLLLRELDLDTKQKRYRYYRSC